MDTSKLKLPEWQCLLRAARGERVADCSLATLARLEHFGLLMRAGAGYHVVTSLGLRLLQEEAAAAAQAA